MGRVGAIREFLISNGIAKTGLMADYPIWILKYFRVS